MPEDSTARQSYGATSASAPAGGDRQRSTRSRQAGTSSSGNGSTKPEPPTTKVEPKVWLASERTFFSWLRVALLLGSFALALFNGGDVIGSAMGAVYALISVATIIYAWYMFQRRSMRIRTAYAGNHDELFGPMAICVLLFAAVLANFIIRIRSHNGKMKAPKSPWLAAYMSYFLKLQDPSVETGSHITFD